MQHEMVSPSYISYAFRVLCSYGPMISRQQLDVLDLNVNADLRAQNVVRPWIESYA